METRDSADGGQTAVGAPMPEPPAAAVGAPRGASPLRLRVLSGSVSAKGPDRGDLDAFLADKGVGEALRRWFGVEGLEVLRWDKGTVLAALDRDIAAIDELVTRQVNAVLHHPRFQRLEASWRGLRGLTDNASAVEGVVIRKFNATWAELCRDFDRAVEFDQSTLFNKVYTDEFGMPGGQPFGALLCDYEVQHLVAAGHPTDDIAGLLALANVAAAAFAPAIIGCTPALFGLESFADFTQFFDLAAVFRQPEYARWRRFQEAEDTRFLGIVLPRVLIRLPYEDDVRRTDNFRYWEERDGLTAEEHLWGTAVWAFGTVLVRAFANFGWFADIRGAQRDQFIGGLVTTLPVASFPTDPPGIAIKYATDVSISDSFERALSDLGFVPLSKAAWTPYSVFYSNQSIYRPLTYDKAIANINARLSAMLQYMFCVGRFAHFLKVIARDRIGSAITPENIEDMLQRWLMQYTTGNDDAGPDLKARFPLREGRVSVRPAVGKPGAYHCTIHLMPHFQLDQAVSSFKLITEITGPGG